MNEIIVEDVQNHHVKEDGGSEFECGRNKYFVFFHQNSNDFNHDSCMYFNFKFFYNKS